MDKMKVNGLARRRDNEMDVLSAADRDRMPKKEFAGPGKSFPIGDQTHARLAISGATRSEHAGNISMSEEEKIKAAARAKLGGDPKAGEMEHHKAAISKMHPAHLHKMVEHAMSGKAGPEMQQMAQQAMQGPAEHQEPDADDMPMKGGNPFSDGDADNMASAPPPQSTGSMFSGGR
jgi:hypothetical protein